MNPLVVIPYCPEKTKSGKFKGDPNLGKAYNQVMASAKDWVLFLDQDVFLLNPNWYKMCLAAIKTVGHKAGWITCWTNRIGCGLQLATASSLAKEDNDIGHHTALSKAFWDKYQNHLTRLNIPVKGGWKLSGFFLLTHKEAWKKTGGFRDGFYGVDVNYCRQLARHGYQFYRMDGLYVYHHRGRVYRWG